MVMIMNEIRKVNAYEFEQAIAFANHQFSLDFYKTHPKLYGHYGAGIHYACFDHDRIIGLLSAYPVAAMGIKILSVGTVCVSEASRGRGIMGELFEFASRELFPEYDLVVLIGSRERYEYFGFYKTGKKVVFNIKRQSKAADPIEIKEITESTVIDPVVKLYNGDIQREKDRFFNILRSQLSKVYLLNLNGKQSYIVYNEKKNAVFEFDGEIETSMALQGFMAYENLMSLELYASLDCDKKLFSLMDRYGVSTLCNMKMMDYKRTLTVLLNKVKHKPDGRLKLAVDCKFSVDITVSSGNVDVRISEDMENSDMSLSEKELYYLLFDDYFLMGGDVNHPKSQLLHSWFPLPLWNTLTTLDGI